VFITVPPIGVAECCDERVCLSVCLSVREHIFGNARAVIVKFLYAFNYGRSSVLFLRRCDTLCTSGLWMTSYGGMPIPLQQLTLLRHRAHANAPAASYWLTTEGAETRRVHHERVAGCGACNAPLPCFKGVFSHERRRFIVSAVASCCTVCAVSVPALHGASSRGHVACVDVLLTSSANVNSVDCAGCTPLFYAATLGHAHVVTSLLRRGANPNHVDCKGRTYVLLFNVCQLNILCCWSDNQIAHGSK